MPGWYADPEVVLIGDTYWIFPTYSARYEEQTFFDCFSSKDLVTWTKHERILDSDEVKWAKRAMWAPSMIEKGGKYYLFFGANDVHPNEIGGIGVAVADKPEGPYKDLLGKPLVNDIVNGAQPIDQFVFKDSDGSYYMIYGGWRHCNVVKLRNDFKGIVPFDNGLNYREITPEGYVEGPCVFIRNGKYYFMWSEGGWTGPNYAVAYAISDSLFGPHKRIGKVIEQDAAVARGAGHHSVLRVPDAAGPGLDKWYAVYHRRPLDKTAAEHRATSIEEMRFNEDGTIQPIKLTFEGVAPQTVPNPKCPTGLDITIIIEPDVRNAHVEAWAEKSKQLFEEWHPKLSEMLASPGYEPPREIRLRFKKMDGVAYASGNEIVVSVDWITRAPDDHGLIVHELVHLIQSYRRRVPSWVTEGIADYIRFFRYEKPAIPRVTEKSKYTDSYRVTGAFFNWIVVNHDKDFISKLNAVCREGKYSNDFFKEVTGKTVDELWNDYAQEAMTK